MYPQAIQRIYAAGSLRALKAGLTAMLVVPFALCACTLLIRPVRRRVASWPHRQTVRQRGRAAARRRSGRSLLAGCFRVVRRARHDHVDCVVGRAVALVHFHPRPLSRKLSPARGARELALAGQMMVAGHTRWWPFRAGLQPRGVRNCIGDGAHAGRGRRTRRASAVEGRRAPRTARTPPARMRTLARQQSA